MKKNNFLILLHTVIAAGFLILAQGCDNGLIQEIEMDVAARYPELQVLAGGTLLQSGNFDFQDQVLNEEADVLFQLKNNGKVPLTLIDPKIEINPAAGDEDIFDYDFPGDSVIQPGASLSFSMTFTPTEERRYSANVTVYSDDPDHGAYSFIVTGTGYVPPDGLFHVNSNISYTTSITVELNMSFSTAPVEMAFSNTAAGLDGSSWEPYTSSRSGWQLQTGADGERTVYARFKDALGFVIQKQDSITLDTAQPTGSINTINGPDLYTVSRNVTLAISAADSLSGVDKMRFVSSNSLSSPSFPLNELGWLDFATSHNYTIPVSEASGDGTKYVYAQFRDTAGNISGGTIFQSIILDTSLPVGSVTVNGGAAYATNRAVSLTVSAADSTSGLADMRFLDSASTSQPGFAGITWKTYNTSYSYTLVSTGEGTKYVYAQFRDTAGNISTSVIRDSIILDTQKPTGTFVINSNAAFTNTQKVRISTSGINGAAEMSFDGNISPGVGWTSVSSYVDVELTAGEGTKTINGYFRDSAGNQLNTSDSIYLNTFSIVHSESTAQGWGGNSVDISADGSLVAVGIPNRTWAESIGGGMMLWHTEVGAFMALRKVSGFWGLDGGIMHTGLNYSFFGTSVSVSPNGTYISVGAPYDGANTSSIYGKVYRYTYGGSGIWNLSSTITGPSTHSRAGTEVLDTSLYRYYRDRYRVLRYGGASLATDGGGLDGSGAGSLARIAIGSTYASSTQGRVYIYDQLLGSGVTVAASDAASGNYFGKSVAISTNATTLVVTDDKNQVYIFQNSGSWVQRQKIVKPTDAGISFGSDVAVSADGTTVAVGCDSYNSWRGAVYVYVKRPSANIWDLVQRVSPSDSSVSNFGYSVAISDDGSVIAAGAPDDSDSGVHILE